GARGRDRDWLGAAGFNRCGPIHQVSGNVDPAETRQELMTEVVTGIGTAFLGLTMNCARCHDHKFDPISLKEYYRLEAFFSRAVPAEIELSSATARVLHARELAVWQGKMLPLRTKIASVEKPYRKKIRDAKYAKLEPEYRKALAVDAKKRTAEQKKLAEQAQTLLKVSWDEVVDALSPADRKIRAGLRAQFHALQT